MPSSASCPHERTAPSLHRQQVVQDVPQRPPTERHAINGSAPSSACSNSSASVSLIPRRTAPRPRPRSRHHPTRRRQTHPLGRPSSVFLVLEVECVVRSPASSSSAACSHLPHPSHTAADPSWHDSGILVDNWSRTPPRCLGSGAPGPNSIACCVPFAVPAVAFRSASYMRVTSCATANDFAVWRRCFSACSA